MIYTIRLYANTGFDSINRPLNEDVLTNSGSYKDTNTNFYLVQDNGLSTVRISMPFSEAETYDYIKIGNAFYYIAGVNMLNDNLAEFSLVIDAPLTLSSRGEGNFTATATRITPATADEENTLAENFQPSHPQIGNTKQRHYPNNTDELATPNTFTGVSVQLTSANNTAKAYYEATTSGEAGDAVVYVPQIEQITSGQETTISVNPGESTETRTAYKLPGEALYRNITDANDTTKQAFQALQSLGISGAIIEHYAVNQGWVTDTNRAEGSNKQYTLQGKWMSVIIPDDDPTYTDSSTTYSPQYKKTKHLYKTYLLVSESSGDAKNYPYFLIRDEKDGSCTFIAFSDPSGNGKPFMRPKWYNHAYTTGTEQAVAGSAWYHPQMVLEGNAGQSVRNFQMAMKAENLELRQAQAKRNAVMSEINTGISAISNPLNLITGTANNAINAVNTEENIAQEAKNERASFVVNSAAYTPEIKTASGDSMANATGNNFSIIEYNITAEDAKNLDIYFNKFGFAEPLLNISQADISSRGKRFCYLEATNVHYNGNAPRWLRTLAASQMRDGVRIWKTRPDGDYTTANV